MGTQIVQHPADYRAVMAKVGIHDMLRHETAFANGPYNVSEYGTIGDLAQFKATLAYSPLQNVQPHTAYPAVLMTTGANDPRVDRGSRANSPPHCRTPPHRRNRSCC